MVEYSRPRLPMPVYSILTVQLQHFHSGLDSVEVYHLCLMLPFDCEIDSGFQPCPGAHDAINWLAGENCFLLFILTVH
jgi:hypothetical protein